MGNGPGIRPVRFPSRESLQALFVGLDHLLDHLAAHGAGFTGADVTVVALLQVDANLVGSLHLELVHSLAGLGDVDAVVLLRHFFFLLLHFCGGAASAEKVGAETAPVLFCFPVALERSFFCPALAAHIAFADRRGICHLAAR